MRFGRRHKEFKHVRYTERKEIKSSTITTFEKKYLKYLYTF